MELHRKFYKLANVLQTFPFNFCWQHFLFFLFFLYSLKPPFLKKLGLILFPCGYIVWWNHTSRLTLSGSKPFRHLYTRPQSPVSNSEFSVWLSVPWPLWHAARLSWAYPQTYMLEIFTNFDKYFHLLNGTPQKILNTKCSSNLPF